ncbi:hypothetical protein E2C01_044776 [Portunus trituberculatus]|uniref:Uncharacterized protein n=1 Tax=Portunus trituberculatus TaxID=210409 RepID=A0A5B7FWH2_PORTR|nr:hypothetical protein [Portunus trituberculatus]
MWKKRWIRSSTVVSSSAQPPSPPSRLPGKLRSRYSRRRRNSTTFSVVSFCGLPLQYIRDHGDLAPP